VPYEVLGRRDEALAGLIARQPKHFGNYVPAFGRLAPEHPPERRRIVDRGAEQRQIGTHDADERSRHREGVSPLVRKRKCSPVGPSVPSG
jgi:hypothetical protein